jgi:hypothetical protein
MNVKLPPDLFPPAHRAGEGALLRVWLLARAIAEAPAHSIGRTELLDAMQQHLDIQERHARNLLDLGDGLWWRSDHKHGLIYIIGVKAIFSRLQGTASDAPLVLLPFAALKHLQAFYARCYSAYLQRYVKGDTARPVSRAALLNTFGVTRNTLRTWEKAAGVVTLRNFAFARPDDFHAMPDRPFEYHCNCGRVFANALDLAEHHQTCKEDFVVVWDRPNSYVPPALSTTGTASPIGRARLTHYQNQRQARTPDETKCPTSSSASKPNPTHDPLVHYGWLTPGKRTHYRRGKVSDPLPILLVNIGIPLTRLWRAS